MKKKFNLFMRRRIVWYNSFMKRRVWKFIPTFLIVWYLSQKNFNSFKKGEILVPEKELENVFIKCLKYLVKKDIHIGDYLEFGVYCGSSIICMNNAIQKLGLDNIRIFGFDSFQGLPPEASKEGWAEWRYCMSLSKTKKHLSENKVDLEKTKLIKGWFSDTLNDKFLEEHNITKSSIIMIDCDIYTSTKQVLEFIEPLMGEVCLIVFDDWNSCLDNEKEDKGQKRAFREFIEKFPHYNFSTFDHYGKNAVVFLLEKTPVVA